MKEIAGILIMTLFSGKDSNTMRAYLPPMEQSARCVPNKDSAIAVELYKAERNIERGEKIVFGK